MTTPALDPRLFDSAAFDSGASTAQLSIRVAVSDTFAPSAQIVVSVVSPEIAEGTQTATDRGVLAAVFGVHVTVGGIDKTISILSEITVEAEESSARVADFSMHVPHGTVVTPSDWVGAPVKIYLVDMTSGVPAESMLLFSGVVDSTNLVPGSGKVGMRCTDNFQVSLAAFPRDTIFSLFYPGNLTDSLSYYSGAVFDDGADSLTLVRDLSSTLNPPCAVDMSPHQEIRFTPLAAKGVADLEFDADTVLDGSVSFEPADRASMTNQVDIAFDYRFPRMKAEGYEISYDFLAIEQTTFGYWVKSGGHFLQRAAVQVAIEKAGATIHSITWLQLPTSAVRLPGTDGFWLPNPAIHNDYCLGFAAVVSFDFGQDQVDSHRITVRNAASMSRFGVIQDRMRGSLEGLREGVLAEEHAALLYKKKISSIPPSSSVVVIAGEINSGDLPLSWGTDAAAALDAVKCLTAIARNKIIEAHRRHSVTASVPCNPVVDLDKTIAIEAQGVTAKGKVRRLTHRIDCASGSATTEFTLAISNCEGEGFTHADSLVAGDIVVNAGIPAGKTGLTAAAVISWNGKMGQDDLFSISFPKVDELQRESTETTIGSAHEVAVAEDDMEVTL